MSTWFRARQIVWATVLCVLTPVLIMLTAGADLPLPFKPPLAIPVRVAPQVAIMVAFGCGLIIASRRRAEAVASRPVHMLELMTVVGLAGLTAATCAALEAFALSPFGYAAARDAIGFTGLLLIGARFNSRLATVVPASVAVFMVLFARSLDSEPERWAWSVADAQNCISWWWATGFFVVGIATHALSSTRLLN
ncbi:hypothetical protein EH165_02445 [Nakamurella antarctica]|uniref:Uncharacterized protein n=1 Tax=Nakamurella antarctica TaxID=1902245 RepID=A0A3G8ZRR0_9ACTN|nr:hypothetical protein [Nakamurella antarctica]AZI57184.1 hypothetical protein EH165_02445 [Nakamurella antarctica]